MGFSQAEDGLQPNQNKGAPTKPKQTPDLLYILNSLDLGRNANGIVDSSLTSPSIFLPTRFR